MNSIMTMAFRNILRNRRRSLLAIISVLVAVCFVVITKSMIEGFLESMVKNYTKNQTGHIRITTTYFNENSAFYPVTDNIPNIESLKNNIEQIPEVSQSLDMLVERFNFGVLLSNNGNNRQAFASAIELKKEKELLMVHKSLLPGSRYIENEKEMIMGSDLAQSLDFVCGDTVKVLTHGSDYALHLKKFIIVGIFKTGLKMLDDALFQISLHDAKILLRAGNSGQQLILMLKDYRDADKIARTISTSLGDSSLAIIPWTEVGDYSKIILYGKNVWNLINSIVILLGAFIISNIMMMVVLERKHELGILKSLGLSQTKIIWMILLEGVYLGACGSIVGALLGTMIAYYFSIYGVDFSSMLGNFNFPIDSVIYFKLHLSTFLFPLVSGICIAAFLSVLPAKRAAQLKCIEAIKAL